MDERPRVGLALGGGGARGFAHIGVLKVLEAEGIPVDLLAGTSMGALVACLYAAGLSAADLEAEALRMTSRRMLFPLTDASLLRRGLFRGQHVVDYLEEILGGCTFAGLRLPVAVVAVDLLEHCEVVLAEGPVSAAVRASIAVPGVFTPVEMDGRLLIDGGVLNNVPADVARRMGAEVLVAVDVHASMGGGQYPQYGEGLLLPGPLRETLGILYESVQIMLEEIARHKVSQAAPEVLLTPEIPADITPLRGFARAREVIAAGEAAARRMLGPLRAALEGWRGPQSLGRRQRAQ
jgi:NTE family protein